jgi:hypothetical protein
MENDRKLFTAMMMIMVLGVIAVAGCATGRLLSWQLVDPAGLTGSAADQKWNAYRFETVGPFPSQRIAYVLFGDNVTVDMWNVPYVNLGKVNLAEIGRDHDAYLRSQMWTGTMLAFHEFKRDGNVIAYTANELQTDVDLWEISASGPKVTLRLVFIDRRSFSGDDSDQSPASRR